jgi:hypothetical protein
MSSSVACFEVWFPILSFVLFDSSVSVLSLLCFLDGSQVQEAEERPARIAATTNVVSFLFVAFFYLPVFVLAMSCHLTALYETFSSFNPFEPRLILITVHFCAVVHQPRFLSSLVAKVLATIQSHRQFKRNQCIWQKK